MSRCDEGRQSVRHERFGGRRVAAYTTGGGARDEPDWALEVRASSRSGGDRRPAPQAAPPTRSQTGLAPDLLLSC